MNKLINNWRFSETYKKMSSWVGENPDLTLIRNRLYDAMYSFDQEVVSCYKSKIKFYTVRLKRLRV